MDPVELDRNASNKQRRDWMKRYSMAVLILIAVVFCIIPVSAEPAAENISFYEPFDRLDSSVWEVQLFTFEGNGCNMVKDHVAVDNSVLKLSVSRNQDPSLPKLYNGGEIGQYRYQLYGLFMVRMKPFGTPGGVSAFFLMNRWQPENWEHKEIDIEFLGRNKRKVQLTTHDFQKGGKVWKNSSKTLDLEFDYTAAFHDYAILWTAESVKWFVDGRCIRTETQYVPHEPLQIRMNVYVGDMAVQGIREWLGPVDQTQIPATTEFDWIKVYPLGHIPEEYR